MTLIWSIWFFCKHNNREHDLHAKSYTYDAVLHTEAQLVFQIWSLDEDSSNRGATDDVHLHLNLVLQAL